MNEGDNTSTTTTATTTTCKNVNKERYLVRPETKETYISQLTYWRMKETQSIILICVTCITSIQPDYTVHRTKYYP